MQDCRTGMMEPLDETIKQSLGDAYKNEMNELLNNPTAIQSIGEKAGIPKEAQGLVLAVGDEVVVKEKRYHRSRTFTVEGFENGLLHLKGVPDKRT